jgi:hypothetical protein
MSFRFGQYNLPKGAPIDIYQDVDFSLNVFPKVTDISVAVQKDDSRRTSKGQSSPIGRFLVLRLASSM